MMVHTTNRILRVQGLSNHRYKSPRIEKHSFIILSDYLSIIISSIPTRINLMT